MTYPYWFPQLNEAGVQIGAFLLCMSIFSFTIMAKRTDRMQNRVFMGLAGIVMLNCLIETVEILLSADLTVDGAVGALTILHVFYAMTHVCLGPLFYYYMLYTTGAIAKHRRSNERLRILHLIPLFIAEVLLLFNPFERMPGAVEGETVMHAQWDLLVIYITILLYFVMVLITLSGNWPMLSPKRKSALGYLFGLVFIGILTHLLGAEVKFELFAEALALMGVMITVENEDERMDMSTKVYNRTAIRADLQAFLMQNRGFHVICVRITNADVIQRLLGTPDADAVVTLVAGYLCTVHPRYYVYRTTPTSFMMVVPSDMEGTAELAQQIEERFGSGFQYQDTELLLQAIVMLARIPEDFSTADDILLMGDGPVPVAEKKRIFSGKDLDFLIRRAEVESALHRGFNEHSFDVYYQPIYRTNGMAIYSAEALLRLRDSRIGNITPDEFIPVAEQNGMIDRIGDYVLEEVCIFLSSGIPSEMGLECISVNLSVLQCMQPDFIERALEITRKNNVEPKRINFEITESVASSDYASLAGVIRRMKEHGFCFSLDRYGIGYSDMKSVFALDFNVVKIDKAILWDAEHGGNGRIILENSVRMLKEMKLGIIAEGVETQEQIELLEEIGVDYLQGYYFSQPVSKSELLGILRVTELARMEEQRAHAASEAKSDFLANMSHEIRTPINALLGMDEMILRESKDPKILEYAQNIEGAGRTLLSLINDILDFSKIESGSMEIDEAEYSLSAVINDVVNMIQIKASQKNLDFNIHVDSQLPEHLYGDEMRNRQIMVNILNNAVKYTKEGSVSLNVTGEIRKKDQLVLKVEISDTGIGIRKEDIGKLFKKFQRLDEEQNRKIEGTGLGLAITYNLLQIMRGEIDVRSEYGKGSTFTVYLPQHIISREAIGDFRWKYQMNARKRQEYHESFRAPDARILVVDDMEVNHTVVIELLKQTQLKIDTAISGKECLEKVRQTRYDLILLDFRMPEMDGIETLKRLRALPDAYVRGLPVIALTADAVAGARERFLNEGFDDYMMKPVDGRRLEEMLIRYLPQDKIVMTEPGEEDDLLPLPAEKEEGDPEWLSELGDIDPSIGIQNCGTVDGYESVLKIYYENILTKASEIEGYFEKADWPNYTILVHALKSSSRIIGAKELSEHAAALEAAGNAGDEEKIRNETADLLKKYRSYADILSSALGLGPDEEKDEDELEEISDAMYRDAVNTMKDFAKMYDYDNIVFVIDSLKDYRLPIGGREKLKEVRAGVESFAWEKVVEKLEEM